MMANNRSAMALQTYVVEPLIHQYLQGISSDISECIERCAIVRWFDEDSMERFICVGNLAALKDSLSNVSFLETRNQGMAFHDLVRDTICYQISLRAPDRYRNLQREAANYYRQRLLVSSRELVKRVVIEMIYHLVQANEDEGMAQLRTILTNARTQIDFRIALLDTVDNLKLGIKNRTLVEQWKNELSQTHSS